MILTYFEIIISFLKHFEDKRKIPNIYIINVFGHGVLRDLHLQLGKVVEQNETNFLILYDISTPNEPSIYDCPAQRRNGQDHPCNWTVHCKWLWRTCIALYMNYDGHFFPQQKNAWHVNRPSNLQNPQNLRCQKIPWKTLKSGSQTVIFRKYLWRNY